MKDRDTTEVFSLLVPGYGRFYRDVVAVKMLESDFQHLLVLLQVTIDLCINNYTGNLGSLENLYRG
jgi:hypothetical protein